MFHFIPVTIDHLPLLREWFQASHVMKWWPTPTSEEDFFEHLLKRIRSTDTRAYVAQIDNTPIGYVQMYHIDREGDKTGKWLPILPEHTIGTDQFIGDSAYIGKGYGTHMLKAFIDFILVHDKFIPDNALFF